MLAGHILRAPSSADGIVCDLGWRRRSASTWGRLVHGVVQKCGMRSALAHRDLRVGEMVMSDVGGQENKA